MANSTMRDHGDLNDYRFGRTNSKRTSVRAHGASKRINGLLKKMIEAFADSKLRCAASASTDPATTKSKISTRQALNGIDWPPKCCR
jgi:hypothetical protein